MLEQAAGWLEVAVTLGAFVVLIVRTEQLSRMNATAIDKMQSQMDRQHKELKREHEAQYLRLDTRYENLQRDLSACVASVEKVAALYASLDKRMTRSESHIDAMGRQAGIGQPVG